MTDIGKRSRDAHGAGSEDEEGTDSLLFRLRRFWSRRQREVGDQWKRTLPLGDYVVDRWEKARALGFGEGVSVYDTAHVYGDVQVGANTWIGPFVLLDGSGGLRIGANCSISAGVQIYSHDTVAWATSGGRAPYAYSATVVGDNCYLGPHTVVARGVTIGDGCVIGAGSLVLSDIPSGSKAYGTPCRVAGRVGGDE